jgi:putative ABC transport system permease protein
VEAKGNRKAVRFLLFISFVILVIAWVNYINLSTAKALDRAKEVGIRKVSGSDKSQLILQFVLESAFINVLAAIFAIGIARLSMMILPEMTGITFDLLMFRDPYFYLIFLTLVVVGIALSGLYPAFVLSRFKPSVILKGKYTNTTGGVLLRRGLVVTQLSITIILIGSTLIADQQIKHMKRQQLGVNMHQMLAIEAPTMTEDYQNKMLSFINELKTLTGVEAVTRSSAVPGKEVAKFLANRREYAPVEEERLTEMLMVDFDYIETYGLELVAGRNFHRDMPTDSTALILNQSAVTQFGFNSDEEAIDERIILEVTQNKKNHIIGVIKDYHQQSLQKNFTPIILFMDPEYSWIPITYFSVSIATDDIPSVISAIQGKWNFLFPESSFDYFFLDDFFNSQYKADQQYGSTFATFSFLAIFIAIMGLFGLTMFTTTSRTKEIGVRKVLGASVTAIFMLLNLELIRLIMLSSIIAVPVAYFIIDKWLDNYAFRMDLQWWVFVAPILVVLFLSLIATGYITLRAAIANPSRSLRYE